MDSDDIGRGGAIQLFGWLMIGLRLCSPFDLWQCTAPYVTEYHLFDISLIKTKGGHKGVALSIWFVFAYVAW